MLKKMLAVVAVSALPILGVVSPAFAADWDGSSDIIVGNSTDFTYWDIDDDGSIGHSGIVHDDADDALDYEFTQVWCGTSGTLTINGYGPTMSGPGAIETDANGDKVVAISGSYAEGAIDLDLEIRAYSEGDLVRTTYVLTNTTNETLTFTPGTYGDTDDDSGYGNTMTGGAALTNNDLWWTAYDPKLNTFRHFNSGNFSSVVFGRYYGSIGKIVVADTSGFNSFEGDDDDVVFGDMTLAAGESYQFVLFYQMLSYDIKDESGQIDQSVATSSAATVSAQAASEFGGTNPALSGRLLRSLDLTIPMNWIQADGDGGDGGDGDSGEENGLPETGANLSIQLFSLAIIAVGAGIVALRRRAISWEE